MIRLVLLFLFLTPCVVFGRTMSKKECVNQFRIAKNLRAEEQFENSREIINQLLQTQCPKQNRFWFHLAAIDREEKKFQDAKKNMEKALEIDPDNPHSNNYLGQIYIELKDFPRAKKYIQKAIDSMPTNHHFLYSMIFTYRAAGDLEGAKPYVETYLQVSKDYKIRKKVVRWMKKLEKDLGKKVIGEMKAFVSPYVKQFADKDFYLLHHNLNAVLSAKKLNSDGYSVLVNAIHDLAEYSGAEKLAEIWLQDMPDSTHAHALMARLQLSKAFLGRGTGVYKTVTPQGKIAFKNLINFSKSLAQKALELDRTNSAPYYVLLNVAKIQRWKEEDVKDLYQKASNIDPANLNLAISYVLYFDPLWGGSLSKMKVEAMKISQNPPPNSNLDLVYPYTHTRIEDTTDNNYFKDEELYQRLKPYFERSIKKFPDGKKARTHYARLAYLAGDKQTAKKMANSLKEIQHSDIWYNFEEFKQFKRSIASE